MTHPFRTLDDADVKSKRVLLRVDLNVPMENGKVSDATRIERVLPTIRELSGKGAKVILLAHFGRPKDGPSDETRPLTPEAAIGAYKRSKVVAEREVERLVVERGLPAVIVNPSTPIGPRDIKPTPTGRIIIEAVKGLMPAYVDTGLNIAHVDDVAMGHWLAFERGEIGERYILGNAEENWTMRETLDVLAEMTGLPAPKFKVPFAIALTAAYCDEAMSSITNAALRP